MKAGEQEGTHRSKPRGAAGHMGDTRSGQDWVQEQSLLVEPFSQSPALSRWAQVCGFTCAGAARVLLRQCALILGPEGVSLGVGIAEDTTQATFCLACPKQRL